MAKQPSTNFSNLRKMAGKIQSNSDSIYRSTYFSNPTDKQQLQSLKKNIDTSIKNIMDNNSDNTGEPNISRMYERIFIKAQNDPETTEEFRRIFEDNEFMNSITNSYMDNRYIKAQDDEIDEILRYMPKLEEALQTLRDNVLSSDSFNKDFLNVSDKLDSTDSTIFSNNIDDLKNKYDLSELSNTTYYNTSKYGEEFIYVVPYKKAIERLLTSKQINPRNVIVKSNLRENSVYIEADGNKVKYDTTSYDLTTSDKKDIDMTINLDKSGIIGSIVEAEKNAHDKAKILNEQSLCEQFFNEAVTSDGKSYTFDKTHDNDLEMGARLPVHHNYDKTLDDDLEIPVDMEDSVAGDGLYNTKYKPTKLNNMNGCIVKRLKRERVIPIYINDVCLGYYYFEFDESANIFEDKYTTSAMTNTITGLRSNGRTEALDGMQRREELIRYLSSELADKIDTSFVNANQDLKKEIYYILKYNEEYCGGVNPSSNIRCTYIAPEDIHHIYFDLNEDTHRGISDLALSLIPAKLWCSIYITNCLAVMTRSNDKRVYYVKQSVESNISKTLLKTINEIKKSNFGMRQIENINNVLDITGRFNDYIIPRGADGQSPIDFEVMQGQQVEIKTELLSILEELAINITGVPIEIIQNRQSPEYAVQLTMQNSKFLRYVYGRQSKCENKLSKLFTRIYNLEYGNTDIVKVTLPPPLFINVTNTNQLIANTSEYCDSVANIVLADEQDDLVKQMFAKEFKIYNLGSYINMNVVSDIINKAKQLAKKKYAQTAAEGEES